MALSNEYLELGVMHGAHKAMLGRNVMGLNKESLDLRVMYLRKESLYLSYGA